MKILYRVSVIILAMVLLIIFMPIFSWAFTIDYNPYIAGSHQPLGLSCDGLSINGNPRNVAVYFSNNSETEMPFYTTICTNTGIGIYLDDHYGGPLPVTVYIMQQNEQSCAGFSALSCHTSRSDSEVQLTYTNIGPAPTPAPSAPGQSGSVFSTNSTINVVKTVINDNGGTKTFADFPLFVNGMAVVSGATNIFPAPGNVYTVTETGDASYTKTFSGDCDMNGQINLNQGENRFCIVTNDDIGAPVVVPPIPPLIDVVKVPVPLALPFGPGPVTYTYTLRNVGMVPVTDITMVGDTCSPITLLFGDNNADEKLDVTETWTYRCTTTLSETHTNNVVATGWANGLSAIDIASATVVVTAIAPADIIPGLPNAGQEIRSIVPPLIHVTKVPSTLALLAGGGPVVYTNIVTNPGTVALSNVSITDDKCGPVKYISGDRDGDSRLDTTEMWTYTCRTELTETTTNTVIASGKANGLTVRDFAIATVAVATIVPTVVVPTTTVPVLPNTGFSDEYLLALSFVLTAIFAIVFLFYIVLHEFLVHKA